MYALVFNPTNPANVFAGTYSSSLYQGGLFVSADGGASWNSVAFTPYPIRCIAFDPAAPGKLYIGTGSDQLFTGEGVKQVVGTVVTPLGLYGTEVTSLVVTPGSVVTAATRGAKDMFLAELGPAGNTLPFATFLGGTGQDEGRGLAVN